MQGAMHSNAAAMPYTMGFIEGWARCGEIYLNLLPKYYVTPRTIPVVLPNGKRDYYEINSKTNKSSIKFDYDVSALEVSIEPGVNFAVQKQIALKTIEHLMNISERFKAFMEQNGLEVLLENIDIKGIDKLRYMAQKWMQEEQEAAEKAKAQQKDQVTPEQLAEAQLKIEASKVEEQRESSKLKAEIDMSKITADNAVKNKEADIKFLEVMSKISDANLDRALQQEKVDAEQARTALEMTTKLSAHLNDLENDRHERQTKADAENERERNENE
jgi:hypothetical protein